MSTEALLPCPFCGGTMSFYATDGFEWWSHPTWGDRPNEDKEGLIRCPSYAWRAFTDEPDRIAAWNRRSPALAPVEPHSNEAVE
jgi:hypothetical protein